MNAPEHLLKADLGYDNGTFFGKLSLAYTGSRYFSYVNNAEVDGYTLADFTAGYRFGGNDMLDGGAILDRINYTDGNTLDYLRLTGRLDIPTVTLDLRYRLAFYESAACDPSGHGEGTLYLGSRDVELSDQPSPAVPAERFVVDLPVSSAVGSIITATATAPNGSTSEFSKCIAVASADTLSRNGFE